MEQNSEKFLSKQKFIAHEISDQIVEEYLDHLDDEQLRTDIYEAILEALKTQKTT